MRYSALTTALATALILGAGCTSALDQGANTLSPPTSTSESKATTTRSYTSTNGFSFTSPTDIVVVQTDVNSDPALKQNRNDGLTTPEEQLLIFSPQNYQQYLQYYEIGPLTIEVFANPSQLDPQAWANSNQPFSSYEPQTLATGTRRTGGSQATTTKLGNKTAFTYTYSGNTEKRAYIISHQGKIILITGSASDPEYKNITERIQFTP